MFPESNGTKSHVFNSKIQIVCRPEWPKGHNFQIKTKEKKMKEKRIRDK